jgi:hypothetical protein
LLSWVVMKRLTSGSVWGKGVILGDLERLKNWCRISF